MSDVYDGLSGYSIRRYVPEIRAVKGTANTKADDPTFDDTTNLFGQWQRDERSGLIRGVVQAGVFLTMGSGAYLFRLPVPAYRPHPTLPTMIGQGFFYQPFQDFDKLPNVSVSGILADAKWSSVASGRGVAHPSHWMQVQVPYQMEYGDVTGGQTWSWTHSMGIKDTTKLSAADFLVNSPSSIANNSIPIGVSGHTNGNTADFRWMGNPGTGKSYTHKAMIERLTHRGSGTDYVGSDTNVPTSVAAGGATVPRFSTLYLGHYLTSWFLTFKYRPA